jgi:hypothetical protein
VTTALATTALATTLLIFVAVAVLILVRIFPCMHALHTPASSLAIFILLIAI